MGSEKKMMEQVLTVFKHKGKKAVELAQKNVLQEKIDYRPFKEALVYFIKDWNDVLHPALVSLACEAVGGRPDTTSQVGAALVLLAGGADVHDDIIDQSVTKGSEPTVFGKFGRDVALLVGDALLLEGTYLLYEASELLPKTKKTAVLNIVKEAFFEISSAEAKEASFRGKTDFSTQEYLEIIRHKVAASEASTRIGAIGGNGTEKEIELLGHYGRTLGILFAIRDEFVDVFEKDEIENRAKKECLPLPIIVAFQDDSRKKQILRLLENHITKGKIEKILDLSMDYRETRELVKSMKRMIETESLNLSPIKYCKATLRLSLESTVEDL